MAEDKALTKDEVDQAFKVLGTMDTKILVVKRTTGERGFLRFEPTDNTYRDFVRTA